MQFGKRYARSTCGLQHGNVVTAHYSIYIRCWLCNALPYFGTAGPTLPSFLFTSAPFPSQQQQQQMSSGSPMDQRSGRSSGQGTPDAAAAAAAAAIGGGGSGVGLPRGSSAMLPQSGSDWQQQQQGSGSHGGDTSPTQVCVGIAPLQESRPVAAALWLAVLHAGLCV